MSMVFILQACTGRRRACDRTGIFGFAIEEEI